MQSPHPPRLRRGLSSLPLTVIMTLLAFAANSLLCRMALGGRWIDATAFTSIRLLAGAVTLALITLLFRQADWQRVEGDWVSAFLLFLYAISFSFAYLYLSTGTGALILFGAVQLTMMGWALLNGERPQWLEWLGLLTALAGLVYLVLPGLSAPSPLGALLMTVAGMAWGGYSLRGRKVRHPLAATAKNFIWAVPLALLSSLVMARQAHLTGLGVGLAMLSGALASGVGYALWYSALPALTTARAAIIQLTVPVLAALAGVIFLAEILSLRLLLAAALILGGIGLAMSSPMRRAN